MELNDIMEADSTTQDSNQGLSIPDHSIPFKISQSNLQLYNHLMVDHGKKGFNVQIVKKFQDLQMLPSHMKCPSELNECKMRVKPARVVDKVQWFCECCHKRLPVRSGSFFYKLQCSLIQTLQMVLAWCEDADPELAAQYFEVKPKVANYIFERIEQAVVKEMKRYKLGGLDTVVLAEIYPDCVNRLSPDTTDPSHGHRILMLADTCTVPTSYKLHILKDSTMKKSHAMNNDLASTQTLSSEMEKIITNETLPDSHIVVGNNIPKFAGAMSMHDLVQNCSEDMSQFLTSRIWRQAIAYCSASQDICLTDPQTCVEKTQRYLDIALYRLKYSNDFYSHTLQLLAKEFTYCDKDN